MKAGHIKPLAVGRNPFFLETLTSIVSGIALLGWAIFYLSNDAFWFSVHTRLRNALFPDTHSMAAASVRILGVDPDAILRACEISQDEVHAYYELVAESVRLLSGRARCLMGADANKRLEVGIDFIFLQKDMNGQAEVARALAEGPPNVDWVLAYGLQSSTGRLEGLRSDITASIIEAARILNSSVRIFLAYANYEKGLISSGLSADNPYQGALGFTPLFRDADNDGYQLAMSSALAILGKDIGRELYQDPYNYLWNSEPHNTLETLWKNLTGHRPGDTRRTYFNFSSDRDVSALGEDFLAISKISPKFAPFALPIFPTPIGKSPVEYWLVGQTLGPRSLAGSYQEDAIVLPASSPAGLAQEIVPVSGVTAQMAALENLLTGSCLSFEIPWLYWLCIIFLFAFLVLGSVIRNKPGGVFLIVLVFIILLYSVSFAFFVAGYLVPLKPILFPGIVIWLFIVILRFLRHNRLGELSGVLGLLRSPALLGYLDVTDSRSVPPMFEGILLVWLPRALPNPLGHEDRYIGEMRRFHAEAADMATRYGGNRLAPSSDANFIFWVGAGEKETEEAAECAAAWKIFSSRWEEIFRKYPEWKDFRLSVDILFGKGKLFCGMLDTPEGYQLQLSGPFVSRSLDELFSARRDQASTGLIYTENPDDPSWIAGAHKRLKISWPEIIVIGSANDDAKLVRSVPM